LKKDRCLGFEKGQMSWFREKQKKVLILEKDRCLGFEKGQCLDFEKGQMSWF
jgi:hypothetical protein